MINRGEKKIKEVKNSSIFFLRKYKANVLANHPKRSFHRPVVYKAANYEGGEDGCHNVSRENPIYPIEKLADTGWTRYCDAR